MAKTRKILLIEDDFDMRELLGELLASRGLEVTTASDGYEAVARIEKATFDLIITDIRLPHLSGIEVARIAQNRPRPAKIILITAFPEWRFKDDASELRVDGIFIKPFNLMGLLRAIEEILEGDGGDLPAAGD
jgi:CheY-like chemotaxis protein